MKHKGVIADIGGALTGSYGKEVALLNRAGYQYRLMLSQMLFKYLPEERMAAIVCLN